MRLAEFRDELDPEVRAAGAVVEAFRPLDRIAVERVPVESGLARATERLAAWRSGAAAPEVRRAAFGAFMADCRAGAVEPEGAGLTTACLDAYAASEAEAQRQWWESLAEQVPPGILLLFLLATLSGLYRYNVRLAGFHNGRADALELLVAQVDKDLRRRSRMRSPPTRSSSAPPRHRPITPPRWRRHSSTARSPEPEGSVHEG